MGNQASINTKIEYTIIIINKIDFRMNNQHSISFQENQERCPRCQSSLFNVNGQRYCEKCKQTPTLLYQQIRNVHQNFRPNSEQFRISGLLKIEQHVQTLLKGLEMFETQSTINQLVQKIIHLHHSRGENCKGYLEESAVIVFLSFQAQHKMTIRQFCKKFRMLVRKFNKIFLVYRRMNKKQPEEEHSQTKIQQKLEEQHVKREREDVFFFDDSNFFQGAPRSIIGLEEASQSHSIPSIVVSEPVISEEQNSEKNDGKNTQCSQGTQNEKALYRIRLKSIILKLYDSIFESRYLQERKEMIAEDLTDKLNYLYEIYKKEHQETLKIYSEYQKILYQIFGVIRAFGHKISQRAFLKSVQKVIGFSLNSKKLGIVKRQINQIVQIHIRKNT